MKQSNKLSRNVLISLLLGALVGSFLPGVAPYVSFLGLIFKLSLNMIVMPVILTSMLCGLESIGDIRALKGMGKRAILYYFCTTTVAIVMGLILVINIKPGVRMPQDSIVSMVNNVTAQSNEDMIKEIKDNLAQTSLLPNDDAKKQAIFKRLDDIAAQNDYPHELKKDILVYLGSLVISDKLISQPTIATRKMPDWHTFFEEQIKNALINPFEALAKQQVLAVIIFTILFGAAMTTIGPLGVKFFEINRAVNSAIIKLITLIMEMAPYGVFGLIVSVVSVTGPEVFRELSLYAFCVVLGLLIHLLIFLPGINYYFTRQSPYYFLSRLKPALLVAFSTSSSNATLPITIKTMEENLGIDKRVSQFLLPLGATINMDGTALYEAVAAVFIAQLYGVSLGISGQIIIALTAAFAAVGTAGIPAAGTVTMALILSAVGLPVEAVGLLFALDRPLDMCRTVVNVAGDATGCNILNKYYNNINK